VDSDRWQEARGEEAKKEAQDRLNLDFEAAVKESIKGETKRRAMGYTALHHAYTTPHLLFALQTGG